MQGYNCTSSEDERCCNDTIDSFSLSELETMHGRYSSSECSTKSRNSTEVESQRKMFNHWLQRRSDIMYKSKRTLWYSPIRRLVPNSNVSCKRWRGKESTRIIDSLLETNTNSTTEKEEVSASSKSPKVQLRARSNSPFIKHVMKPPKIKPLCPSNNDVSSKKSESVVSDQGSAPKSVVSVKDRSGTLYRLEFTADNPRFTPLYINLRHRPQTGNEKKVQPLSRSYSSNVLNNEINSFFKQKKYAIVNEEDEQPGRRRRGMSSRVYTDEVSSSRRSKSAPERVESVGFIYISYNGILLKLKSPPLMIKQIKQLVSPDITAKMRQLGMPSSESRKNKGTVVCRHGYDLFQISFEMSDISFNRAEIKGTAAVQTEDKLVYIREISPITQKPTLLALPESTYFYEDPMKTLHRLHISFQGTSIMPLWKYEMMRARVAESRGFGKVDVDLERAYKQTRGSRLLFEGLGGLISTEDGLLCCDISSGYENYESMMLEEHERNGDYRKLNPPSCSDAKSKATKDQPTSLPKTDVEDDAEEVI